MADSIEVNFRTGRRPSVQHVQVTGALWGGVAQGAVGEAARDDGGYSTAHDVISDFAVTEWFNQRQAVNV